jgi:hypothetical protein
MSESLPEPLEDFLQRPPSLQPRVGLQGALLQRTAEMLPRPHGGWRRRWTALGAAAAGILLAVLATYFSLRRTDVEPAPPIDRVQRKDDPAPVEPTPSVPPRDEVKLPSAESPANPLDLEWTAFDTRENQEKVRLYFQAGNLYLERYKDFDGALRCYHQALQYCAARDLELDSNDNWLVMNLKRDRRKEH